MNAFCFHLLFNVTRLLYCALYMFYVFDTVRYGGILNAECWSMFILFYISIHWFHCYRYYSPALYSIWNISFQFNCSLFDLSSTPSSSSPSHSFPSRNCSHFPDSVFLAVAKIIIVSWFSFSDGSFRMKFSYFGKFNCILIRCKTLSTNHS